MWKFIKRTLQVIAALIVVGIGYLLIDANSEVFATDVAYLECTLDKASPDYFNKIKDVHGLVGYARIQKDHIKDTALLTWLDINGDSETGTDPTIKMYISSNKYSSKTMNITRSFDRNTLRYRWVAEGNENEIWFERSCVKTTKQKYETQRQKEVFRIKSRQNI